MWNSVTFMYDNDNVRGRNLFARYAQRTSGVTDGTSQLLPDDLRSRWSRGGTAKAPHFIRRYFHYYAVALCCGLDGNM